MIETEFDQWVEDKVGAANFIEMDDLEYADKHMADASKYQLYRTTVLVKDDNDGDAGEALGLLVRYKEDYIPLPRASHTKFMTAPTPVNTWTEDVMDFIEDKGVTLGKVWVPEILSVIIPNKACRAVYYEAANGTIVKSNEYLIYEKNGLKFKEII